MSDTAKKKVFVITGATSGIGRALVNEFSKNSTVFAGYRNPKYEKELSKMENVIPFFIDMEKPYTITGAADLIRANTDRIDVLIIGAGCVIAGPMEHMEISRLRRQFEVNTFSHIELTQNLLPLLEGGRVINISSMASFGIFPFIAPYCASKRALDILFNAMEVEMRGKIKVISIKPGVIATPLWEKSISLNKKALETDEKYSKEMNFLAMNAEKNGTAGLSVEKVVNVIKKAAEIKNPKVSYTIGTDALIAQLASRLPLSIINSIMKLGMKKKFG